MNRNQIITVVSCVALGLGIYLFVSIKKPKDAETAKPAAPMQQQGQTAESLDIENYIAGVNADIKDRALQQKIQQLTNSKSYNELITEYQKLDKPLAVAY